MKENTAKIKNEEAALLEEYQAQTVQDDKHEYSVYGVDSHSDDGCCC